MTEQFKNNVETTLSAAISTTTRPVVFTVASASGFPTSGDFRVLIGAELLKVTNVSGTSFTGATDATEPGTVATHSSGDAVIHVLTAASLDAIVDDRVTTHSALEAHPLSEHLHADANSGGVLEDYAGIFVAALSIPGDLTVHTGGPRFYLPPSAGIGSSNWELYACRPNVVTPSSGAALWIDVDLNDLSIWDGANHDTDIMKITAGNRASAWKTSPNLPVACDSADYFTIDIDQIGSGTVGADLTVELAFVKVV